MKLLYKCKRFFSLSSAGFFCSQSWPLASQFLLLFLYLFPLRPKLWITFDKADLYFRRTTSLRKAHPERELFTQKVR